MAEVCRTAVPVPLHQQPIMQVLAWAFHRSKRAGRCCCEERGFERHGADGKRSCSSCAGAPHGLYQIAVWLGNTQYTSITTENMLQILNATKSNVYHILQVFAKDGQLNLAVCAGKGGQAHTNALWKSSRSTSRRPPIPPYVFAAIPRFAIALPWTPPNWSSGVRRSRKYIDTSAWRVINLAASVQYARDFPDAGQFEVIEKTGNRGTSMSYRSAERHCEFNRPEVL